MLHADDISTDPTQLLAYMVIGLACGLAGSLFVRLNFRWMAFRKRHAKHWLLRRKYAWSTLVILVYTVLTIPVRAGHRSLAPPTPVVVGKRPRLRLP